MLSRWLIRRGESESSSITRPWGTAKTIYKKMASKTVTVLLALAASVGARAARLETKEELEAHKWEDLAGRVDPAPAELAPVIAS